MTRDGIMAIKAQGYLEIQTVVPVKEDENYLGPLAEDINKLIRIAQGLSDKMTEEERAALSKTATDIAARMNDAYVPYAAVWGMEDLERRMDSLQESQPERYGGIDVRDLCAKGVINEGEVLRVFEGYLSDDNNSENITIEMEEKLREVLNAGIEAGLIKIPEKTETEELSM